MTDKSQTPPEWTEGVCGDGAAILRDGVPVSIADVLTALTALERLRADFIDRMNEIGLDAENV